MAVNKVQLADGTVLMDSTGTTVTPGTLASGVTALDASGQTITGTLVLAEMYYTDEITISSAGTYTFVPADIQIDANWRAEAFFVNESNKNLTSPLDITTRTTGMIWIKTETNPKADVVFTLRLTKYTGKATLDSFTT